MPTRHLAGARAVKVLAVALAICALGSASRPGAQGFESDVNTIQTDLRDAYQRDFSTPENNAAGPHWRRRNMGLFPSSQVRQKVASPVGRFELTRLNPFCKLS
jgi:hypothetical protein